VLDRQQDDFDNMSKDVQKDEEGQRAEEVVEALEQAAACCDDAISACREVLRDLRPTLLTKCARTQPKTRPFAYLCAKLAAWQDEGRGIAIWFTVSVSS
jgi:hypothetical protein